MSSSTFAINNRVNRFESKLRNARKDSASSSIEDGKELLERVASALGVEDFNSNFDPQGNLSRFLLLSANFEKVVIDPINAKRTEGPAERFERRCELFSNGTFGRAPSFSVLTTALIIRNMDRNPNFNKESAEQMISEVLQKANSIHKDYLDNPALKTNTESELALECERICSLEPLIRDAFNLAIQKQELGDSLFTDQYNFRLIDFSPRKPKWFLKLQSL